MTARLAITPALARRLALARQRLSGPRPSPDAAGILEVVRDLGCLQLDPTSAVARTHLIVLWSRLGQYDPAHLDTLLWEERRLFEYWAHAASIVLTEDFPVHNVLMRQYATGPAKTARAHKYYAWLEANAGLRRHILGRLRKHGPLPSRAFTDSAEADWHSTGWTSGRNTSQMLDYLWTKGKIMVAGRDGGQKLWDLAERCLPDWTPRERLPEREAVRRAVEKSLRALGVATPRQIAFHFTRGRYPGLPRALSDLVAEGRVIPARIADDGQAWPGEWYIHAEDLPVLDRLRAGEWEPRTTLLSPFDNLICDRARLEQLFDFNYRVEIYVPKDKRKFGYYVLPILHGDRLIGRIDPLMDRASGRLNINAVYAEPGTPKSAETALAIRAAVEDLAAFLGARDIEFSRRVPQVWQRALR